MTFRTITYTEYNPGQDNCFLFLPPASHGENPPTKLTELLQSLGTVIYVNSGYFGINRIGYAQNIFVQNLHDLLDTKKFCKICIVAGSVGAIHAVALYLHNPKKFTSIIMGAPAFRKHAPAANWFSLIALNLLINLDSELLSAVYLKIISHFPQYKRFYDDLVEIKKDIGAKSFLLCLKEIVEFSNRKKDTEEVLKKVGIVALGTKDGYFNNLCDRELCKKAKCFELDTMHGIFTEKPQDIFEIVKDSCNFPRVSL